MKNPLPKIQTCEICGCDSLAEFKLPNSSGKDIFPIIDPTRLHLCEACGFVANDKAEYNDYCAYYSTYNRHVSRPENLSEQDQAYYLENIQIVQDLGSKASIKFSNHLDVGPGNKQFSELTRRHLSCSTATFDIGENMPTEKFDLISLFHTIEHWQNPKEQLRHFRDLMTDNGLLFIAVPDVLRYEATYYGAYAAIDAEHINHFSIYSLQSLINLLGLKVVYWTHSDRQVSEHVFYPEVKIIASKNSFIGLPEDTVFSSLRLNKVGLQRYLAKSQRDFNILCQEVKELIFQCKERGEKVVLYGLGIHGRRLAYRFQELILADSNPFYRGKNLNGKSIYGPQEIIKLSKKEKLSFLVCAVNSERITDFLSTELKFHNSSIHEIKAGRKMFPADQNFRSWRDSVVIRNKADGNLQKISLQWQDNVRVCNYQYLPEWFGRPIIQDPQDILAIQEIIYQVQPSLIIETGIARGGSLSLSATLMAALDHADSLNGKPRINRRVIGIDIDIRKENLIELSTHPLRKMMILFESSSIAPEILPKISEEISNDDVVLVILDSNHTRDHVFAELCLYSKFVTSGSYIIVQDTGLEDADQETFSVVRPWGLGNGPKTAVNDFLSTELAQDFYKTSHLPDKYLITSARDGFLLRL
jgi:cephalosporin hydroxylase